MYKRRIDTSWDFRKANTKEYTHGYHSYPAMMIPQIARKLLNEFRPEGQLKTVFDPYIGSGTTLVECWLEGIDSIGTDINPLARMISKTKTTFFEVNKLGLEYLKIKDTFLNFEQKNFDSSKFSRISKKDFWYSDEMLNKLDYIENSISLFSLSKNQPFFELCLAELVRECSFTRNREFKRYKMSEKALTKFNPNPFELFEKKVARNLSGLKSIRKNTTLGKVTIDSFNTISCIPDYIKDDSIDMIITSPPYGDSRTTVAYGQFSRWANEWFDFENAKILDRVLMGGKRIKEASLETNSIKYELDEIKSIDIKRYYEVISFLEDYEMSIRNVSKKIRKGGRVCFVVGNRTVKGVQIPLDFFTAEKFEANGFKLDEIIVRNIPSKRMPSKNSPTNEKGKLVGTMTSEYIVILTKKKSDIQKM